MSQSGFTPIQLYRTATASASPTAGNLSDGELAINYNDGKLFYKDSSGVVQTISDRNATSGLYNINTTNAFTLSQALTGSTNLPLAGLRIYNNASPAAGLEAGILFRAGSSNSAEYGIYLQRVTASVGNLIIRTSSSPTTSYEVARFDSLGNFGLGTTPSAWSNTIRVIEIGPIAYVSNSSNGSLNFMQNGFVDSAGDTKYKGNGALGRYTMSAGEHIWSTATSGSAGATATLSERLRLTNVGNLGIGITNPTARLHVFATGTTGVGIFESNQSASFVNFVCTGQTSGQPQFGAEGSNLVFNLGGGTRIRVLPDGNLFQNVASFSTQAGTTGIFNPSGGGIYSVNGLQQRLSHNSYLAASGNATYQKSDFACEYRLGEGVGSHSWFTAASGTAGATISFGGAKMFLSNAGHLKSSNSGSYGGSGTGDLTASACHLFQNDQNNGVLRLISTNTGSSATTLETYLPTGAAGNHFTGRVNNATSVQILANGNIQNTNNSYGSISDVKLKENILPAKSYLERFMRVQYKTFNFIGSQAKQFGVIAQELEGVFPGLVEEVPVFDSKGKDTGETQKTVKYSVLAQIQGKVIQEQQQIIELISQRLSQVEVKLGIKQ